MAERKRFTATDLLDFAFTSVPQLSPDGSRVAFVRTTVDAKENTYRSAVWLAPADGSGRPRRLTAGPRDNQPRWSPDGRYLAFLADREGARGDRGKEQGRRKPGAQLWILPMEGGEARPVTNLRGSVGGFVWSPDGRRIAFVSWVKPEGPEFMDEEPKEPEDEQERLFKKFNEDVRHIKSIRYRLDGFGYFDERNAQVFVVDVEEALGAEGRPPRPRQVTRGTYNHGSPAWSPDGRWIAVAAARGDDWEYERYSDIWVFPADGEGEPVKLTRSTGPAFAPSWSPDGTTIAYLGHDRPRGGWYSNTRLWTVRFTPDGSDEPRLLTGGFDRSFGDQSLSDLRVSGGEPGPVWSPDGASLYCTASVDGTTQLFRVEAGSGEVTAVTRGDHVLYDVHVLPGRGLAAGVIAHPDNPGDVYVLHLDQPDGETGVRTTRLTRVNEKLLSERIVSLPERFHFSAPGGPRVDGWVVRPVDFDPARRYPAVLEIHGGPMAQYTSTLFFEFQLLAAAGIAVIYTNPRGSEGYGEEFCAGIAGDWGNNDFADLMAGVDAALERFPWIDAERLGVAGGSYGGYMTAWITGHTDRFKAACVMRPVINCYSFFGTSDGGYMWEEVWGQGKPPWENPEEYLRQSPIAYAGNVRTPTLIEAEEQDYRCLIEQAEQWYVALKKRKVEAEFIRYPNESHGMSRGGQPWHRIHRLRAIVEWFTRHLEPEAAKEQA